MMTTKEEYLEDKISSRKNYCVTNYDRKLMGSEI